MKGYDEEREMIWVSCDVCGREFERKLEGTEYELPSDEEIENVQDSLIVDNGLYWTDDNLVCSSRCEAESYENLNDGLPNPWNGSPSSMYGVD